MSNIIITGVNGFIGSLLLTHLIRAGEQVSGWVRRGSSLHLIREEDRERVEIIDYWDEVKLQRALESVDVVIHLAGATKARTLQDYRYANVALTERMIRAANEAGVKQFVYLSSQAAAGPQTTSQLPNEDDDCAPLSDYGRSKLEAEHSIRELCAMPWTILRPVSVYGPGDSDFFPYFRMAKRGFSIISGTREQRFNLIDARDLVACIQICILNPAAHCETFFVSDGRKYRMNEFVMAISHAVGRKVFCFRIPQWMLHPATWGSEMYARLVTHKTPVLNSSRLHDFLAERWLCSTAKVTEKLGFKPQYPLNRGVGETWRWYREHHWL